MENLAYKAAQILTHWAMEEILTAETYHTRDGIVVVVVWVGLGGAGTCARTVSKAEAAETEHAGDGGGGGVVVVDVVVVVLGAADALSVINALPVDLSAVPLPDISGECLVCIEASRPKAKPGSPSCACQAFLLIIASVRKNSAEGEAQRSDPCLEMVVAVLVLVILWVLLIPAVLEPANRRLRLRELRRMPETAVVKVKTTNANHVVRTDAALDRLRREPEDMAGEVECMLRVVCDVM